MKQCGSDDFYRTLNEKQNDASVILCDNRSAISIAKNLILHGRTKHIDIRNHFIHDLMKNGIIEVKHCRTNV